MTFQHKYEVSLAQAESENEMTRTMLEAARVAVANALKEKQVAASTRERAESKNSVQGNELCG